MTVRKTGSVEGISIPATTVVSPPVMMTVIGVGIGAPLGLFAGTYLAEYGKHDKLTSVIRFINDILLSAPSIIIGLFIYGAIVVPMGGFSAFAGSLALAVIVIPVVVRTTEDMFRTSMHCSACFPPHRNPTELTYLAVQNAASWRVDSVPRPHRIPPTCRP